jgi:hypothetical protein
MIGAYKTYDQSLSDKYDTPGREAVKKFLLREWDLYASDYKKYEVDLICSRNGKNKIYVEVEVRPSFRWEFPFETIHIPERKAKLFDNNLPTIYFVVNKNFTKALWINTNQITNCDLVENPNCNIKEGEYFYNVPKKRFQFAQLS